MKRNYYNTFRATPEMAEFFESIVECLDSSKANTLSHMTSLTKQLSLTDTYMDEYTTGNTLSSAFYK